MLMSSNIKFMSYLLDNSDGYLVCVHDKKIQEIIKTGQGDLPKKAEDKEWCVRGYETKNNSLSVYYRGIDCSTVYNFRILAVNVHGDGVLSPNTITYKTPTCSPPVKIYHPAIRLLASTEESLFVEWAIPAENSRHLTMEAHGFKTLLLRLKGRLKRRVESK